MNKSSSVLESSFIIEDEESMVAFGGKLAEALSARINYHFER